MIGADLQLIIGFCEGTFLGRNELVDDDGFKVDVVWGYG
jgi:hypothetical protein